MRTPCVVRWQVDETVEGIKAVPRNTQAAARQKADDLVKAILKIPRDIGNAAKVGGYGGGAGTGSRGFS